MRRVKFWSYNRRDGERAADPTRRRCNRVPLRGLHRLGVRQPASHDGTGHRRRRFDRRRLPHRSAELRRGAAAFRGDRFPDARAAFERADPAQHDPRTQFYIAYSYYRQGFGRVYNDDALFRKGLDVVNRAIAVSSDQFVVDDPNLGMRSAAELKAELERGLTTELDDLNPLKLFRARK